MTDAALRPTEAEVSEMLSRHFAAKAACDREVLADQFIETLRWWAPLSAAKGGLVERPIEGASRMIDLITKSSMYEVQGREWTVLDFVTDGVTVAVRARLKAVVAATGKPYENEYTFYMRMSGLRIAEVWEMFDSAYALEQLLPS